MGVQSGLFDSVTGTFDPEETDISCVDAVGPPDGRGAGHGGRSVNLSGLSDGLLRPSTSSPSLRRKTGRRPL